MKIAMVHPSFGVISVPNQPNIKAVAENYGVYPNMSLLSVAGSLQKAGHKLLFLDAMASNYSLNDMAKKLKKFKPDIMMFSIMTSLFHETISVIKYLNNSYPSKIVVGGQHMSLYPKETLKHKEIDFGIIGEAEHTVVELITALESNSSLRNISGLCYRKKRKIVLTKNNPVIKDLDVLPFPARNLIPMDKYYSFISKKKNYAIIMSSRGCPFKCIFCEQRTGNIRYRSPKNVVDEVEECYNKYNVREIDFFDPLFTLNKNRVVKICNEILRRKIDIIWSCRSRVDTVDKELLTIMKQTGCYRIYFGIESADEKVLKNIGKNTKLKHIKNAINLTEKSGILPFGYFMFGSPGETVETIKKTISLAKELPLAYAQFSRYSILPGTLQYKGYPEDYWREYVKDKSVEKPLERINCELSDSELDYWIKKAYKEFYFRPLFLFKTMLKVRSLKELWRYSRAAKSMLKH